MPKGIPGKPIIICADCNQKKEHHARGLCGACYKRYARRHNPDYRKKAKAYCRKWHAEHREERLAYHRDWRKRNPEYQQRWYQRNREAKLIQSRCWEQRNRDKRRIIGLRRRACKAKVANTLTQQQIDFETNIACSMWPDEKLHIHHIVPISKGGGHTWGNIMVIPAVLNQSIGDKLPEEVYQQLELA